MQMPVRVLTARISRTASTCHEHTETVQPQLLCHRIVAKMQITASAQLQRLAQPLDNTTHHDSHRDTPDTRAGKSP